MNPDQRLRLSALLAKSDLDATETAEKNYLSLVAGAELAAIEAEVAAAATPPAPEATPGDDPSLSLGQRISGLVSGNASLVSKLSAANAQLATTAENLATAQSALTAANEKIATLEANGTALEAAKAALEGEAKTVSEAATQSLAAIGVPRGGLPAAKAPVGAAPTIETLNAAIAAETDPLEKGKLSNQAWDLFIGASKN